MSNISNTSNYTLVIANKAYSSWSLRPWLLLKHFHIAFTEKMLDLADANFSQQTIAYGDARTVPILIHHQAIQASNNAINNDVKTDLVLQDSLAIAEYLADVHAHLHLWPQDTILRAQARYICTRMHSGFQELRKTHPMNTRRTPQTLSAEIQQTHSAVVQRDIQDIFSMWHTCLASTNNIATEKYLFGDFSIADAYFAPIVIRFHVYQIKSTCELCNAYMQLMLKHPAIQEWFSLAQQEKTIIAKYEL
jgi:glutathione S-transferase